MITIDYTITVGNIIEIGSIVIGGLLVLWTLKSDVSALKTGAAAMQLEIKKIADILINQADQNRRIIHLEDDLRELRHGKGFIQGGRGIDKEYP